MNHKQLHQPQPTEMIAIPNWTVQTGLLKEWKLLGVVRIRPWKGPRQINRDMVTGIRANRFVERNPSRTADRTTAR